MKMPNDWKSALATILALVVVGMVGLAVAGLFAFALVLVLIFAVGLATVSLIGLATGWFVRRSVGPKSPPRDRIIEGQYRVIEDERR